MQTEIDWPNSLRSLDPVQQSEAVEALHAILLRGLRIGLQGRNSIDAAHIEDFAQDALLKIMERLHDFKGESKFTTWAQAIALNVAFTELRRKRWQDVSLDSLKEDGVRLTTSEVVPDKTLDRDEESHALIAILRKAIEQDLTERQRIAIVAKLQEVPMDQIADLLNVNRNAAYKILHDARLSLKKHLQNAGISSATIRTTFHS